ncbi:hypothetical protein LGH83_19230 [Lichenihabitans sp. PAMC28606]|uniref:hypothetical protein n=1 Tax=Lichenihabitans sp. PAMC28606 TaxID=2880932 RepID=UPI001D0A01BB|nr:hypothetical protein [Lichenihabitans sp. PAMC28606]UDL94600.1 hypothetical protein LGH83_19230 [Lichenihabitans sp. PAMC28606]
MAVTADELKAGRAALLLRCQRLRDDRRRREVARAEGLRHDAASRLRQTHHDLMAYEDVRSREIGQQHDRLAGQIIDLRTLTSIQAGEAASWARSADLAAQRLAASAALSEAEAGLNQARLALQVEARITQKRERLAETMAQAWRRAADIADEMDRGDQVADLWRAST